MFEINICFTYIYVLMKCWFTINSYTYYDYIHKCLLCKINDIKILLNDNNFDNVV